MELIHLINHKYISDESHFRPLDFARVAQFLTLDVITAIAFGKSFGYCNNDEDRYDYIKTTEASFPILAFVTALPMLGRLFTSTVFRTFVMPNANDKIGLGKAMG